MYMFNSTNNHVVHIFILKPLNDHILPEKAKWILKNIWLKCISEFIIYPISALIQETDWQRSGAKPFLEEMLADIFYSISAQIQETDRCWFDTKPSLEAMLTNIWLKCIPWGHNPSNISIASRNGRSNADKYLTEVLFLRLISIQYQHWFKKRTGPDLAPSHSPKQCW